MRDRCAPILIVLGVLLAGLPSPVMGANEGGDDVFSEVIRSTEPLTPAEQQAKFHLPPGFEIDLIAAEPDIAKPMNLAFDSQGRIWVTSSVEYPFAAPENRPGEDTLHILEDEEGDGAFETVTTFAGDLNIPIGVYPFNGGRSALVYSIPNIWRLDDTNGDGQADKREVLYGPIGDPDDTHGMQNAFTRGFDGWLYVCHGFRNSSVIAGRDGSAITLESGNTYRVRLDGSRVEQYTWGQVNPFGMCLDAAGNFYTADCHSSPIYQLIRDGRYPSFGKAHDGLGFAPLLMQYGHESTAICGLTYYGRDGDWPSDFRNTMFVGNVMKSCVHRDRIQWNGSSPSAKKRPDFLTCDDPWFRPVDIQMGPDGAMYIADFYNRIIGHYEVRLDHPERDRFRGRIWRVRYIGENSEPKTMPKLAQAKIDRLIKAMSSRNLTSRLLATHEVVDRIGKNAAEPLRAALTAPEVTEPGTVHCLWALQRIGELDEATLEIAAKDPGELVRIHLMRMAGERDELSGDWLNVVRDGLADANPKIRREAAAALARHPASGDIDRLVEALRDPPSDDDHLVHTLRIALCSQVRAAPEFFDGLGPDSPDAAVLARIAPAVATAPAASFLVKFIERHGALDGDLPGAFQHAARYLPMDEIAKLQEFAKKRFDRRPEMQLTLLNAIGAGLEQRGAEKKLLLRKWAGELARRLLHSRELGDWTAHPRRGSEFFNSPWRLEEQSVSGRDAPATVISSHWRSEGNPTGILRSKSFTIPERLSFVISGHDGPPAEPGQHVNFIRLCDAASKEELIRTYVPGREKAQVRTWELDNHKGKQGYIEVVDGNIEKRFAWVAAGDFSPPVVELPAEVSSEDTSRILPAMALAAEYGVVSLEPELGELMQGRKAPYEVRAAALEAVADMNSGVYRASILKMARNIKETPRMRAKAAIAIIEKHGASAMGSEKKVVVGVLGAVPASLQREICLALAAHSAGAAQLLDAVEAGTVSAHFLQDNAITEKLAKSGLLDWESRVADLTEGLDTVEERMMKVIAKRSEGFVPSDSSPEKGALIFEQQCSACHRIGDKGSLIAPQLDGIGARGAERLIEDILAPNFNVDRAFRYSIVTRANGESVIGLFRREEGESLVFASVSGEEFTIPREDITEREESRSSLMPPVYADALPEKDFYDLLSFLLKPSR